jgi:uncharacterized protein YuzE
MKGRASYDPDADAIGVYFAPEGAVYVESQEIAPGLTLDFDAAGRVIGLEILGVKQFLADRALPAADGTAEGKAVAAQ